MERREAEALRAWLARRRAGEEWERAEAYGTLVPVREAFARGMELIDFAAELHGWPIPADAVGRRQDAEVRLVWRKLRERLGPR
jgi:hypothetical protein